MFKGKIVEISPIDLVGPNATPKQTLVVQEVSDQYPQSCAFAFFKDKTSMLDNLRVGDVVNVKYSLKANNSNGRWFNNINGVAVDVVSRGVDDIEVLF